MGVTDLAPEERNDSNRLTHRLLRKLKANYYWIQLDGMEELLEKATSEFPDSSWQNFFEQCLDAPSFPSKLILTSQALPKSIKQLEQYSKNNLEKQYSKIHSCDLLGLSIEESLESEV